MTQCSLLYALRERRRARMSDLASHECLTQPTVTRAVTRLQDLGMVTRTRDMSDHRNVWIAITPRGLDTQRAAITGLMTAMLGEMTLDEVVALDEALAPLERITRPVV